jgi:methylated-DNA-protein-cysteine methyltransferase-like protein
MADYAAPSTCYQRIYAIVRDIPPGKVMTYGQIADMVAEDCTAPVPAVQVGRAMHASTWYAPDLPWWRVIGRQGDYGVLRKLRVSLRQREQLAAEGVLPDAEGRYDLSRYLYAPAAS